MHLSTFYEQREIKMKIEMKRIGEKGIKKIKEVRQKNNYISIMKADWFNSKFKEIREVGNIKKIS